MASRFHSGGAPGTGARPPEPSQRRPAHSSVMFRELGVKAPGIEPHWRNELGSGDPGAPPLTSHSRVHFVNICMIGAGYVGLVSAACFSEFGWKVACVDKDAGADRAAPPGPRADLRAAPRGAARAQPAHGADQLLDRTCAVGRRGRPRVPRRGHADAARRRSCRSLLRVSGGRGACAAPKRLHRDRDQIDGAGRHQPRDRAAPQAAPSRRRFRRLLEPRVPARRLGDLRFHPSRPRARRLRRRARPGV